ncbi:hypothetical protein [Actinoplanes sp. NPDC049599]
MPRQYASRDLNGETPEFDDRISSLKITSAYCGDISAIGSRRTS